MTLLCIFIQPRHVLIRVSIFSVSTESSAIIRFGFFVGGLASMCVVMFIIWMVKNARRQILKTKGI